MPKPLKMKATELEDYSTLVTKDYLDAKLKEFRLELQLAKQEREFRILRRVQIGLFILIWGTLIAQVVFIIFFRK
jgi:hypothetical protein